MSMLDKLIFMNFVDMQHINVATSNVLSKERNAVTMAFKCNQMAHPVHYLCILTTHHAMPLEFCFEYFRRENSFLEEFLTKSYLVNYNKKMQCCEHTCTTSLKVYIQSFYQNNI